MSHAILFTGHMMDRSDRPTPRFPASKEAAAAAAIRAALRKVMVEAGSEPLMGIAAAACGGDILFHEACRQGKIPSELFLGIPVDAFRQTSVAFAGPGWVARYDKLAKELPVHILMPNATADAPDLVWEEANQWMLDTALAGGGTRMTLIALWDGKKGDGLGGAEHMVRVATAHQAMVEIIDVLRL